MAVIKDELVLDIEVIDMFYTNFRIDELVRSEASLSSWAAALSWAKFQIRSYSQSGSYFLQTFDSDLFEGRCLRCTDAGFQSLILELASDAALLKLKILGDVPNAKFS